MTVLSSPLFQWIAILYFTLNLMVIGAILAARMVLTTIRAFRELQRQRKEIREQYRPIPASLQVRHHQIWRRQKRWELLSRKSAIRRRKGGKPWM
jgi:hypothetical protein